MLRVGLWGEALCAPPNGTRTLVASLVRDLLRSGGYEITVVLPADADITKLQDEFDSPRLHFLRAGAGVWSSRLSWLFGLNSLTTLAGSQHVWLSGWHWPLGRQDTPFLTIVHDVRLLEAEPAARLGALRRALWKLTTFASLKAGLRRAASVVCVSRFTRDRLISWFPAADGRIEVIHNGIDVEEWAAPPPRAAIAALRDRLGLPPGSDYVLGIGAHSEQKNFPALIRAFARLTDDAATPHLVIAGREAADTARMKATAEALGVSPRVIFVSGLADEEIRASMHGARLFAFPSLYEGFGIPVLEAFAAGTPVVSSAIAPVEEVAADAAFLVDPHDEAALGDALQALWDDPERRAGLARAGRARVAAFHQAHMATRYRRLIDRVAGGAAPVRSGRPDLRPSVAPPTP
jgi:glycosyltransferase involved in cell wall biosynthesis